jgi:hypothetical protein
MTDRTTVRQYDEIMSSMHRSLWDIANTPLKTTGKPGAQKHALRLLLNIRGGVNYVISRPPEELLELARRGIWDGPLVLGALAELELGRRRRVRELAELETCRRQILRDLRNYSSYEGSFVGGRL